MVSIGVTFSINFLLASIFPVANSVLFPQYTVLQIVAAMSWPVDIPDRKFFINLGFQFNYNLPFSPTSFYNPMYFPRSRAFLDDGKSQLKTNVNVQLNSTNAEIDTTTAAPDDYHGDEGDDNKYGQRNRRDMSAGELYASFENTLMEIDYDKSCLLKSICELARSPLSRDEQDEDLLSEIVHFILTPSEHKGFHADERHEQDAYEKAEQLGSSGADCSSVYSKCAVSMLDHFSSID